LVAELALLAASTARGRHSRRHRRRTKGAAVRNTNSTQDREISLAEQAAAEAAQHFSNLQSIIIELDQTISDLSDVISGLTEEKRVLEEDNEELRRIIEQLKA
jgi:septal ring factor EnvC (AmiA/AmiB activator)